jgi:hypothetical protein
MGLFDDIWSSAGGSSGFGSGDPSNTDASPASGGFSQAGVGAGIGLAGLGIEALGTMEQSSAAKDVTQADINIAGIQQKENAQRQLAMQINARRQQTQQIRDAQLKQSQGLASATSQGAQFGSGLSGGQAQIAGQANYNLQGINQNLQIGNTLFDLSNQQSQQQIAKFQAQSAQASASGLSSIGGDLLKAAPMLAQFAMFV